MWLVITPFKELSVGDTVTPVRVHTDRLFCFPSGGTKDDAQWVPTAYLDPMHAPTALPANSPHAHMEPFLTRTPSLMPVRGWDSYIRGSGVQGVSRSPRSWYFMMVPRPGVDSQCAGKTGGLHMSQNEDGSRRCQLSLEYGVCGDSLMQTIPGTKAGVLMYLPSMGGAMDTCYESAMSMSFSALLIVYIETVSLVRKAIYATPSHPLGGRIYGAVEWDHAHVPFSTPWPVASDTGRTINMRAFVERRVEVWLQAERVAAPEAWKPRARRMTPSPTIDKGDTVYIRFDAHGVSRWEETAVRDVTPLVLTTPHEPGCVGYAHGTFFYC